MYLFTIVPSTLLTKPKKREREKEKKNIEKHRKIIDRR